MTEHDQEIDMAPPPDPSQPRGSERFEVVLKQFGSYSLNLFLGEMKRTLKRIAGEVPFALGAASIGTAAYMLTPEGTLNKELIPVISVGLGAASYFAYQGYRAYQRYRR